MGILKVTCPACGKEMTVDFKNKAFLCNACGYNKLITDSEIFNKNSEDIDISDQLIQVENLIKNEVYDTALGQLDILYNSHPNDYRIYKYYIWAYTENFNKYYDPNLLVGYHQKYLQYKYTDDIYFDSAWLLYLKKFNLNEKDYITDINRRKALIVLAIIIGIILLAVVFSMTL